MKIFIDEAGNTGGVALTRNRNIEGKEAPLNFLEQPLFVNAAIVAKDQKDENELLDKYESFKKRFAHLAIDGEIKGSSLTTRDYNDALDDFIDTVLDDKHIYINAYNKKFYLSTLFLFQLFPNLQKEDLVCFYLTASTLSKESDGLFTQYCKLVSNPTQKDTLNFFSYLAECSNLREHLPILANCAKELISESNTEFFRRNLLSNDAYAGGNVINLINLTSLGELIGLIKEKYGINNTDFTIFHDKINGIQNIMEEELRYVNVNLLFEESKNSNLIQMADNTASSICHFLNKCLSHLYSGSAWKESNTWDNEHLSKLVHKISNQNCKLTVSLEDQAVYRSLSELYAPDNLRKYDNAFEKQEYLNESIYIYLTEEIESLASKNETLEDSFISLKR